VKRIQSILENIGEDCKEEMEMYGALRRRVAKRLIKGAREALECLEKRI
jgi:hypothetical protein